MTLEKLKAYRAKCEEVQNTSKGDIEYIRKDIQHTADAIIGTWDDFVAEVKEFFQYLPSYDVLVNFGWVYGRDYARVKSIDGYAEDISIACGKAGNQRFIELTSWINTVNSHTQKVCIDEVGACKIESGNEKMLKLELLKYRTTLLEELIPTAVVNCNKELNNAMMAKNKELLADVENLKEEA